MPLLDLTPDQLLTTTRSVRKRLDLNRPVEREVIEECLAIAHQAPTGSNRQDWHFVVVTDPAKRAALGDCYRRGWQAYRDSGGGAGNQLSGDAARDAVMTRIGDSSTYLSQQMGKVPVLVVPCIAGRTDGLPAAAQAGVGLDPPRGLELHARRPRPGPWHRLDHAAPAPRARGGRDPRHPLRRVHAGGADPGRLHHRHRL